MRAITLISSAALIKLMLFNGHLRVLQVRDPTRAEQVVEISQGALISVEGRAKQFNQFS